MFLVKLSNSSPREMSTSEYQLWYDCGVMPPRFWPREFAKLREDFARDTITLQELEDSLDDMMGITFSESMGYLPHGVA